MLRQRTNGHIIIVSGQLCNLNSVPRQTAGQVFACRGLVVLSLMHSQIYIGPGERCFLNVCLLVGICKCLRVCVRVCVLGPSGEYILLCFLIFLWTFFF